jgi:hypothetical protein
MHIADVNTLQQLLVRLVGAGRRSWTLVNIGSVRFIDPDGLVGANQPTCTCKCHNILFF